MDLSPILNFGKSYLNEPSFSVTFTLAETILGANLMAKIKCLATR